MTIQQRLINIAQSQVGISEIPKGSNDGPDIKKYLAAVHINYPAPWCMAFVQWCLKQAVYEMKITNSPLPVSAGVLDVWNKTPKAMKHLAPQPGDIFIMDFGKGLGHAGIVTGVMAGKIRTIEGNSNDEGSREGYEVCRRTRSVASIKGYIRL